MLKGRDDEALRSRLKALAERYPRYGCPTLHDLLRAEGLVLNHKPTEQIYGEEGLQVRTKKPKKLNRPRVPLVVPDRVNQRWSVDFVSDQLANGRRFRVFNVVDDFSRECVLQVVDYRLKRRLQGRINDEQKAALKGYSSNALTNIQTLAETAVSEKVKLDANKDLLDRAGWKPIDKSEVTTHDDVKNKTHDEIMEELDALHRRCGLKTVSIDSIVLDNEHPDYQYYLITEPELADFTSESDVPGWGDSDD